jgi:hypothetical protein
MQLEVDSYFFRSVGSTVSVLARKMATAPRKPDLQV